MNAVATLPARTERTPVMSGATPQALVPTSLAGVWQMSEILHNSGMAPRDMNTTEKISVAIMHGMEVGLTPMAAVQSIAVVNGRPTIWGDGAIGLVRASGLCEYIKEWIEGDGDNAVSYCETKRKGEKDPVKRSFSVADAKTSGLWTKRGRDGQPTPWQTYPRRMMQMRARAFALRDAFADVLRGLAIREEMEDVERGHATVEPPPAPVIPPAPTNHQIAAALPPQAKAAEVITAAPETSAAPSDSEQDETYTGSETLMELETNCSTAQTQSDLEEIRDMFAPDLERLSRSDREVAEHVIEKAVERVKAIAAPQQEQEPESPAIDIDKEAETIAEYRAQAEERVRRTATADDGAALRQWWFATTELRDTLRIPDAERRPLKTLVFDRLKAVK